MALLDTAGRAATWLGEGMGLAAGRLGESFANHPKRWLGGAAALGVWGAHPIRNTHPLGNVQEALFNDAHVSRRMLQANLYHEVLESTMTPSIKRQYNDAMSNWNTGNAGYPYYPPGYGPYQAGQNSMAPDGALVFGLWNQRLNTVP